MLNVGHLWVSCTVTVHGDMWTTEEKLVRVAYVSVTRHDDGQAPTGLYLARRAIGQPDGGL